MPFDIHFDTSTIIIMGLSAFLFIALFLRARERQKRG
jgi:hypothetical protein